MFSFNSVVHGVGVVTLLIIVYRVALGVYRRLIRQPKKPTSYGKWAIVTGSTSGIGKEYADYLAKRGMSILIISRSKDKLIEQCAALKAYKVDASYLAYDFTDAGPARDEFYAALDKELQRLDGDGGIGLLINNVGTTNQYPQTLMELSEKDCNDMINCNMHSTVFMTRAALKYMAPKNKGAVVNVSSGSGLVCAPYIAIYSATK
jgi:17beta-estradiol 17-dehydrogenase / very-long-chain 3-oxoacyl-CoA reductase